MAQVSGNVIGDLSGRLGNLSARTVNGKTILAARPSSYTPSQEPAVLETRQKFSVTATLAKHILSLDSLSEIWKKSKEVGLSVFNSVFRANFQFVGTIKPTADNIITPGGFALPVKATAVDTNKITAATSALNTTAIFGADEVNLSANALVVFSNPVNPTDPDFQIVDLSKEVSNFNFIKNYNLQIDYNIVQSCVAAKYKDSALLLAVAFKDTPEMLFRTLSPFPKLQSNIKRVSSK